MYPWVHVTRSAIQCRRGRTSHSRRPFNWVLNDEQVVHGQLWEKRVSLWNKNVYRVLSIWQHDEQLLVGV